MQLRSSTEIIGHVFDRSESPMAAPAPQQQRLLAIFPAQSIGDRLERAVQRSAIIASQIDQPRLHHEAA